MIFQSWSLSDGSSNREINGVIFWVKDSYLNDDFVYELPAGALIPFSLPNRKLSAKTRDAFEQTAKEDSENLSANCLAETHGFCD